MSIRTTQRLGADAAAIAQAAAILRRGGLVAFPTETVYGLGANALDAAAVRGIFTAKGRPADDPVIVHLGQPDWLERVAVPTATASILAERFWPGPLTLVLRRQPAVPDEVTAGLETVAVRVPSHPLAHALLEATGLPLGAPSANLFGRPSPTRAQHVLDDLDGRIDAVVDGGPATLGVESTIVDLASARPRLLRPGGVPAEAIEALLGTRLDGPPAPAQSTPGPQRAPGLLPVHYAPRTPLVLITGPPAAARLRLRAELEQARALGQRPGVLLLDDDADLLAERPETAVARVGRWSEPATSASMLFEALRALDRAGLDVLLSRDLADPQVGLGRALADRLRRAAQRVVHARMPQ
jgi:L-threonylcarbamoyladenylate synthase